MNAFRMRRVQWRRAAVGAVLEECRLFPEEVVELERRQRAQQKSQNARSLHWERRHGGKHSHSPGSGSPAWKDRCVCM
ncbi:unnamed protein product [Arctogadus glacialis]